MKIVNERSGLMECKKCGRRHNAQIKPNSGGQYYHGAWQCENGCKLDKKSKKKTQKKLIKIIQKQTDKLIELIQKSDCPKVDALFVMMLITINVADSLRDEQFLLEQVKLELKSIDNRIDQNSNDKKSSRGE